MKFYTEIELDRQHCSVCPFCEDAHFDCVLQNNEKFRSWSLQMENCPLKKIGDDSNE